jgi:MYXO-CTERM domain-containing protein
MVLGGLAGCAAAPGDLAGEPAAAEPVPAGAVRGEVVRYVLDMEGGEMEEHFYLRTNANEQEQRLLFPEPRRLEAGTMVDVWGDATADGIRVQRLETLAAPATESNAQALITDQSLKPRRFAFVLVDLGGGVNLTKAAAEKKLFGVAAGDKSVRQYYIEASYGRQDIGGDVFGPIKGTMSGCNFPALASSLRGQVPTGYDHYLWYFGNRIASCGFAGVAISGTPARVQRDTWYNAASDCVVLVQEPTHNFGAMHSSSMKCRNGMPFADQPGGGNCTHNEYGDPYDPMGRACRHMNGYQKAFQGWFGGCNVVDVNESATFTLSPIETPCDGPQVLQIKMPKARPFAHAGGGGGATTTDITHYYLEYRAPIGFDTGLTPVVQVRVSGDIRARTQRGFNTWLLDMNPATTVIEGMVAGGSYTDPAGGIKFTVMSIDAKGAVVKVDNPGGTGTATCLDGKALPNPAPSACSAMVATPSGAPPAFPADGGAPPPPPSDAGAGGGTGGSSGGSSSGGGTGTGSGSGGTGGSNGGVLVPIATDAGTSEGFKDAGSSGTSEPNGGSSGGRSGNDGSGGSSGGSSAPITTSGGKSGGCDVGGSGGSSLPTLGLAALALGFVVRRRRR